MTTTLLAVDDSKTMRKVLEITFAGEGFRTIVAEGAEEALGKFQSERPGIVLVDANMEGASGYDLCARIKGANPLIPVILLASRHHPFDRARGTSIGVDDFIDKPFDTQQLIDKVKAVLRKAPEASAANAAAASRPQAAKPAGFPSGPRVAEAVRAAPSAIRNPQISATTIGVGLAPPPLPRPQHQASAATVSATATAPLDSVATTRTPPAATRAAASREAASPAHPPAIAVPAELQDKLSRLGLTAAQVDAVLTLSKEIVEKVVWEVVPTLAETLIKEEIQRLTSD